MERSEFNRSIRSTWSLLNEDIAIGRTVSSLHSLAPSADFNEIALDGTAPYQDIYIRAVSISYYNLMLFDFSVFQFSWSSALSWRLAYLPNPWITGVSGASNLISEWEALEALGDMDQEAVAGLISELPFQLSVPPIRFEYAVEQYRELSHPAAHFHIGRHTENRWPVSKALSPVTFALMIAKMYYNDYWSPCSSFQTGNEEGCLDNHFIQKLSDNRRVHDFSLAERRSLHFDCF